MESIKFHFESISDEFAKNGFAIVDEFLPHSVFLKLRKEMIIALDEEEFKKAAIGKNYLEEINTEVRGDKILWLNKKNTSEGLGVFFEVIQNLINYLNQVCYAGVNDFEFHYAHYPKGTFYKKHLDQFIIDDARIFSVVFYLNQNWNPSQGGNLKIYKDDGDEIIDPIGNRLVFFDSGKYYHEVLPTNVSRFSLTGWLKKTKYIPL